MLIAFMPCSSLIVVDIEMQETIRKTAENTIIRSGKEIMLDIDERFVETLPWIDFAPIIAELEERRKEEGKVEGLREGIVLGKAERDQEIVKRAFAMEGKAFDRQFWLDLGISSQTIEKALKEVQDGEIPNE